jgi:uncharacterized membrane protein
MLVGAAGGLVVAIVLWGGYSRQWSWTGINGQTATLWDWLHLLLLPLAVAVLPVWFSRETRVHPRTKAAGFVALALFVLVVTVGYAAPWNWTGFRGNTLWDWINLVLLPLTVLAVPRLLAMRGRWQMRHSVVAAATTVGFGALVLGGYLGSWGWTGFTGNTLWNWMQLLFLPLLLPTLVVPALLPIATARVVYLDRDGNPIPAPAPETATPDPGDQASEPPSSAEATPGPPTV